MMNNLSQMAFLLGSWANHLPTVWRKRVYKGVKVLAGLATLALLVLPMLPSAGINWSGSSVALTVATGLLTFLGHLADRNTTVEPQVDMTPAPEGGNPAPPEAA